MLEVQSETHWKKFYCKVSTNQRLVFYLDDSCSEMEKSIDLRELKGVVQGPQDHRIIQLHAGEETAKLRAKSIEISTQWTKEFKRISKQVRLAGPTSKPKDQAIYQGQLWKRAIKSGRNWKKRWFVLSHDRLAYYAHEGATKPKGWIELTGDSIVSIGEPGAMGNVENYFILSTPTKTLYGAAALGRELKEWLAQLERAIRFLAMKLPASDSLMSPGGTIAQRLPTGLGMKSADQLRQLLLERAAGNDDMKRSVQRAGDSKPALLEVMKSICSTVDWYISTSSVMHMMPLQ